MLDLLGLVSLSFAAALYGAVVPGPVFVVVVSEALKKGRKAGPMVVLGHLAIEAFIVLAAFLGLDVLLDSSEATALVRYVGGLTLVLMGLYLARTARNFKADEVSNSNARFTSHGLVAAGFLASGSNPHFFFWWLTIGIPTMALSLASAGAAGFTAFLIGHAVADLSWFTFISYSVDKGRTLLSRKVVQTILLGSAILLLVFGFFWVFFG
ncbi:MAG: LysE family translocator [Candidatus Bathyarchaeota archaeon]|nr:LysE family translocator [Candidatus Bathyarchaeota archaeon]